MHYIKASLIVLVSPEIIFQRCLGVKFLFERNSSKESYYISNVPYVGAHIDSHQSPGGDGPPQSNLIFNSTVKHFRITVRYANHDIGLCRTTESLRLSHNKCVRVAPAFKNRFGFYTPTGSWYKLCPMVNFRCISNWGFFPPRSSRSWAFDVIPNARIGKCVLASLA